MWVIWWLTFPQQVAKSLISIQAQPALCIFLCRLQSLEKVCHKINSRVNQREQLKWWSPELKLQRMELRHLVRACGHANSLLKGRGRMDARRFFKIVIQKNQRVSWRDFAPGRKHIKDVERYVVLFLNPTRLSLCSWRGGLAQCLTNMLGKWTE